MSRPGQRLCAHFGETWLVEDSEGNPHGHFIVPPKGARVKVE